MTTLLFAQVNIEIDDGTLVETTGGIEIQVSGDVVENGSGYLNGIVTSGDRSSVKQFAGFTLSSPLGGKITRITGKQYSGADASLTRYYEVDNQGDSDLIANVTTLTTTVEQGNMTGPFFHYTKNGNNWKGYDSGSSGTTIVSKDVLFPHNSLTDLIISEGVKVEVKIFLEGPYNVANHNMNDSINNIIPLTSPYSADKRTASNKPSTAVDWILVQLRDQTTPYKVITSRSAFLSTDGNIIDDNSTRGISIAAPAGDYYIAVKHRNHLAIMSANPVSLSNTATLYDFTDSQDKAYSQGNNDAMAGLGSGNTAPFGLRAGNGNPHVDNVIDGSDFAVVYSEFFDTGYKVGDYNMDNVVDGSDFAIVFSNFFKTSYVSN